MKQTRQLIGFILYLTLPFQLTSQTGSIIEYPGIAHVLSSYVQIPSESGHEKGAGVFLKDECLKKGLNVRVFTDDEDSYNFAASIYPLDFGKPNIIFLNHIDVVSHGHDCDWTYPPYSGKLAEGMVWGRGSIDNKGMAVMQLAAIVEFAEAIKGEGLPFNVTLLSVSAEETGGEKGAKIISERFLNELNPMVILGEGGSGVSGLVSSNPDQNVYGISVAHKRGLWLKLKLAMETSGHGSVPPKEYVNKAMVKALTRLSDRKSKLCFTSSTTKMFNRLGQLEKGYRSLILRNINFFKPLVAGVLRREEIMSAILSNTITLTNMSNPVASLNVISQSAEAVLDCRLLPETDTEGFISQIKRTLKDERIQIEIINESSRAEASKMGTFYNVLESSIKAQNPDAGVIPILFPAFNDNNFFRAKGVPVYGILPIHLEMDLMEGIHNSDERISIQSLEEGKAVYLEFLLQMMESSAQPTALGLLTH